VQNFTPRTTALPLTFGKAMHAGLAAHYANKPELVTPHLNAVYDEAAAEPYLPAEREELRKQQNYVQYAMKMYQDHYAREPWTVLAPEVEGDLPLGTHRYFFRADVLVSMRGHPWLLEHKTTSQLGPTFFSKFRNDGQITMYCYGIWQKLGTRPVGVIINAIRKSRSMDKVTFERELVMRPQQQIEDYVEVFTRQADQIEYLLENHRKDKQMWLMYTGACVAYHRACDYLDLCLKDSPDMRLMYKTRTPDYVDEGGSSGGT